MLGVEYGSMTTIKSLRWWDAQLSLEVWEGQKVKDRKTSHSPESISLTGEKDFDWKLKTKGFTVLGEFSTTNRILNAVTKAKTAYGQLHFYIIPQISQSVAWPESLPVTREHGGRDSRGPESFPPLRPWRKEGRLASTNYKFLPSSKLTARFPDVIFTKWIHTKILGRILKKTSRLVNTFPKYQEKSILSKV